MKALELHVLQKNPISSQSSPVTVVGALVQNEKQSQENPKAPSGGDMAATQVFGDTSQSAVLSRWCGFESLTVEGEDQRPTAKRQLSSESAARNITVVKKSAVRKDAEEQKHVKAKGQMVAPGTVATGGRRRRKDLFTSAEVFHRVDTHVLRTGAEVKVTVTPVCEQHKRKSSSEKLDPKQRKLKVQQEL